MGKTCHSCRLDYKQANKANEWEDKFSERELAKRKQFCPSCRRDLTWWWFVYLPVTADQVARFLARGDFRRKLASEGSTNVDMAEQKPPLQLENGL